MEGWTPPRLYSSAEELSFPQWSEARRPPPWGWEELSYPGHLFIEHLLWDGQAVERQVRCGWQCWVPEWEMQVESWRGPPRLWTEPGSQEGSQVALVVKHPPASAGDERDASSIPGSGRSAGGAWPPTPVFLAWKMP